MATINLNQPIKSSSGAARPVLPTDIYRMRIVESTLERNSLGKPDKVTGELPLENVLVFEITSLSDEQADAAADADEDWSEVRIWKRFNPYYGDVKAGGPSRYKEFIDNLVTWGLLVIPDMDAFDVETLCGIELKCSVENYKKTQGANVGQPGNKITSFAPVRVKSGKRNAAEPAAVDSRPELAPADQF